VRRGAKVIYTQDYLRLKGTLGMGSVVLAKGHPERKGCVERANGYLETSFLPGGVSRTATISTPSSATGWNSGPTCGSMGAAVRPSERIDEDLAAMMALPPVLPDLDTHRELRLPADHWVRHHTNDYSVHPRAVGRRVHVKVDDAQVVVTLAAESWPATTGCWPPT